MHVSCTWGGKAGRRREKVVRGSDKLLSQSQEKLSSILIVRRYIVRRLKNTSAAKNDRELVLPFCTLRHKTRAFALGFRPSRLLAARQPDFPACSHSITHACPLWHSKYGMRKASSNDYKLIDNNAF